MSPAMMGALAQQQKDAMMAAQAGQTVVPASGQPGRNTTPQPLGGMQVQNRPNAPQGAGQGQRPQQMQSGFQQMKMDPAAAAAATSQAAQMRNQAAAVKQQLQGQPGGLGGPMPPSQSPAMNTLNTPVSRQPIAMGQMDAQQVAQNASQFGHLDPRFNQHPVSMGVNSQLQLVMNAMGPEQRARFEGLPPDKLNELMSKWQATSARPGAAAQMLGRPGQGAPGQLNPGAAAGQFSMGANLPQAQALGFSPT